MALHPRSLNGVCNLEQCWQLIGQQYRGRDSTNRVMSFTCLRAIRMSLPNAENASSLENAMQLMIQTFHKYSGNEGDKYTLSKAELKDMLTTELGNYLDKAQDKEAVENVMCSLDSNGDGEVDFTEFIYLVGALTVACNEFFLEFNEKPGKK
ncbi:S100 calcium binding protein T isoform X2 [Festucalex cinctus]